MQFLFIDCRSLWLCLSRVADCWWQVRDGGCHQDDEDTRRLVGYYWVGNIVVLLWLSFCKNLLQKVEEASTQKSALTHAGTFCDSW